MWKHTENLILVLTVRWFIIQLESLYIPKMVRGFLWEIRRSHKYVNWEEGKNMENCELHKGEEKQLYVGGICYV